MTRSLLLIMLALGACAPRPELSAPAPVVVHRVEVKPPLVARSDLSCKAEPAPLADDATQADGTDYTLDLVEAGRDCRRKLGKVSDVLKGAKP